jgi:aryl-alcohol dehydrogenase-like predicted oxidoreductase
MTGRRRPCDTARSEIAFGTGDTAGALVQGDPDEQRAVVARALELGITLFDTSPDYGKGLAEVNLGRVLRELKADDALVMTKVEIMPEHLDPHLGMNVSSVADRVVESVEDSLTRMRRDHVDVLVLHNPSRQRRNPAVRMPWTPLTPDDVLDDVLTGLDRVLQSGKTRLIGAACERAEVSAVRRILDSGRFDLIDIWFNLINPTAGRRERVPGIPDEEDYTGLLALAEERGVGVGVIRPLAGGALTSSLLDHGQAGRHRLSGGYFTWKPEMLAPEIARGRRFAALARPGEQTLAEAAYRYLLGHQTVTTVIGGFSDPAHLDDAARAVDAGPLEDSDLALIEAVIREGFPEGQFTPPIYATTAPAR